MINTALDESYSTTKKTVNEAHLPQHPHFHLRKKRKRNAKESQTACQQYHPNVKQAILLYPNLNDAVLFTQMLLI